MDFGIRGKVALVTGASRGLGFGIAQALAGEGAQVAVSSRSQDRIEEAAAQLGAHPFVHDSADLEAAPRLVGAVEGALGPIEILVTNTGGPPSNPDALSFGREQWEAAYRDLVLAPMALTERVVPGMRERGWGRIVNVSSSAVREPLPSLMLSNTHRAAMLAGFKTLARQLAADGITVNSILPGRFATERLYELSGGQEEAEASGQEVPAGRLGTPEEFGTAAAFLCSEQAGYITGVALLLDGGLTRSI